MLFIVVICALVCYFVIGFALTWLADSAAWVARGQGLWLDEWLWLILTWPMLFLGIDDDDRESPP